MKLSAIRAALAELDLAPSKSLGQNFLHDQNLARWIVGRIGAEAGDELIEIGPGLGALTEVALETGANVTALEKDARLAEFLRARFDGRERLNIVPGDALDYDVRTLWGRGPVKVFGNLPYYVSTPLLFHFTSPACPAQRVVFLLQREVAERLAAAGPGTKDYGLVSVIIGRRWRVELLRVLPASVFLPEPKVDSALIALTLRPADDLPPCDVPTFDAIVRAGFSQRRKQLRGLLRECPAFRSDAAWTEATQRLGVPATTRGEELTLRQWTELSNFIKPVKAEAAQNLQGERFDVVDEADRVIGSEPRGVVHARGLRHRAVHLFVFNARGELFIQKRSAWKDRHPGKWDSSASGHVDHGENYAAAARRELSEELGVSGDHSCVLVQIASLEPSEGNGWSSSGCFVANRRGHSVGPPPRSSGAAFSPVPSLNDGIEHNPADFAPGFLECWTQAMVGDAGRRGKTA